MVECRTKERKDGSKYKTCYDKKDDCRSELSKAKAELRKLRKELRDIKRKKIGDRKFKSIKL